MKVFEDDDVIDAMLTLSGGKAQLEDIQEEIDAGLFEPNDWEEDFLDSIEHRLDSGWTLSESQSEKLAQIWRKVTHGE